jgi:RNA polymerase sigma factor (sigma-70 family)
VSGVTVTSARPYQTGSIGEESVPVVPELPRVNPVWGAGAAVLARDLNTFCHQQYPQLLGMLGLYCGDRDLAEELTQETLARVCRHWSRVGAMDNPERWVVRVAFNLAKSAFRSRSARQRVLDRYGPSLGKDVDAGAVDDVLAVRAAVARLPERQRRALLLRYFADLPVAEVASLMECPEGTVKTLTFQAIAALRRAGLEVADA